MKFLLTLIFLTWIFHGLFAHPLVSENLDYPLVSDFESFYALSDPDEHLINGGLLLIQALRCTACHPAPENLQKKLEFSPAINLQNQGFQSPSLLWNWLKNPYQVKVGTTMPTQVNTNEEKEIITITEFLINQSYPLADVPKPSAKLPSGQDLFHQINCIVCHQPASDYTPISLSINQSTPIEFPVANLSAPLKIYQLISKEALFHRFSQEPFVHAHFHTPLTADQIHSLIEYLLKGETTLNPTIETTYLQIKHSSPPSAINPLSWLQQKQCLNCHSSSFTETQRVYQKNIHQLQVNQGCLADFPLNVSAPQYHLSELQKKSLNLAIQYLNKYQKLSISNIDWLLLTNHCYQCHSYRDKGGLEMTRAPYFTLQAFDLNQPELSYPPDITEALDQWPPFKLKSYLLKHPNQPKSKKNITMVMPNLPASLIDSILQTTER
jgi:cytochrome c551/c552